MVTSNEELAAALTNLSVTTIILDSEEAFSGFEIDRALTIQGGTIKAVDIPAANSERPSGIYVTSNDEATIQGVRFVKAENDEREAIGILTSGSNTPELTIRDCEFTDFRMGIYFNSGASGTIEGNIFSEIMKCAIGVESDGEVTIEGNTINSGKYGIEIHADNVVVGENIFGEDVELHVWRYNVAVVKTDGELRAALANPLVTTIILGNDIALTEYVNLDRYKGLTLDGNGKTITTVKDARNNCGLYLASDDITVKNVTITGTAKQGIDTGHGTTGLVIENVTFEGTDDMRVGFYANKGVQGTVENCTFGELGIGIGLDKNTEFSIQGNNFSNINRYLEIFADLSYVTVSNILANNEFDVEVEADIELEGIIRIVEVTEQ